MTGVSIAGGILGACFGVLILLLVICYLERRRRRAERTRGDNMDYGLSRQSSFVSGNDKSVSRPVSQIAMVSDDRGKKLFVRHSNLLPQSDINRVPPVSQPPPKMVASVSLPTPPSSNVEVTDEGIRKPSRPAPPQPLLLPPRLRPANGEVLQGYSSETVVPVNRQASPSSRVRGEMTRKPSLPRLPPPLILYREGIVRQAPKIKSVAKLRTVTFTFTDGGSRDSLVPSILPGPWDSGARPQHASFAFDSPIFQRPSFLASASLLKSGLPRNPRDSRFMPPKTRYL